MNICSNCGSPISLSCSKCSGGSLGDIYFSPDEAVELANLFRQADDRFAVIGPEESRERSRRLGVPEKIISALEGKWSDPDVQAFLDRLELLQNVYADREGHPGLVV